MALQRTDVAKAAALLDIDRPDWYTRINVDILHMDKPCSCVLGQVYRREGYMYGYDAMRVLGYSPMHGAFSCDHLTREIWLKEIHARRQDAATPKEEIIYQAVFA